MNNVKLIDGTIETVGSYANILELIREKLSPDIAELLSSGGKYGYEDAYLGLDEIYENFQEGNIYEKVMESTDLDEVKSYYDDLYYDLCGLL